MDDLILFAQMAEAMPLPKREFDRFVGWFPDWCMTSAIPKFPLKPQQVEGSEVQVSVNHPLYIFIHFLIDSIFRHQMNDDFIVL